MFSVRYEKSRGRQWRHRLLYSPGFYSFLFHLFVKNGCIGFEGIYHHLAWFDVWFRLLVDDHMYTPEIEVRVFS